MKKITAPRSSLHLTTTTVRTLTTDDLKGVVGGNHSVSVYKKPTGP